MVHRQLLGIAVWCSTITSVAWHLTVGGSVLLVGSAKPGPSTIQTGLTRANEWVERTTRSTSEALGLRLPRNGRFRPRDHGRRLFLLQQDGSRSAADDWEIGSREEMMAKLMDDKPDPEDTPHPLRTQDWKLEMRARPWKIEEQEVSFHRNGTVETSAGDAGTWWFDVGGLYWDVNTTMRAAPTVLHHKAELHWNVFGDQPRMFRGTVTRDRLPKSLLPPWLFRPVVGSFVGSGVGNDTSDTSYAHRQTGGLGEEEAMPPRVGPQTDRY